jgi:hypothetical protein
MYKICVYDQVAGSPAFKMGASVAARGMCGISPCWRAVSNTGWVYRNSGGNADGITKVLVKGGVAGKPRVQVQAKGTTLPLPTPISGTQFFDEDPAVIVQLYSSTPPNCWSSSFTAASTKKNDGVQFKATNP